MKLLGCARRHHLSALLPLQFTHKFRQNKQNLMHTSCAMYVYYQIEGRHKNIVEIGEDKDLIHLRREIVNVSQLACASDTLILSATKPEGTEIEIDDNYFENQCEGSLQILVSSLAGGSKKPILVKFEKTELMNTSRAMHVCYQIEGRQDLVEIGEDKDLVHLRREIVKKSRLACAPDTLILSAEIDDNYFEKQCEGSLPNLVSSLAGGSMKPILVKFEKAKPGFLSNNTRDEYDRLLPFHGSGKVLDFSHLGPIDEF